MNKFNPNYTVPSGATLREVIDFVGLTPAKLAEQMRCSKKIINGIITGDIELTTDTALNLEKILGVPAEFWSRLEANYRSDLLNIEKQRSSAEQALILR